MIYRKLKKMLSNEFNVAESDLEEGTFLDDLGIDLVDLGLALEETFELEEISDLSNLETLEDLIDFLQGSLDA